MRREQEEEEEKKKRRKEILHLHLATDTARVHPIWPARDSSWLTLKQRLKRPCCLEGGTTCVERIQVASAVVSTRRVYAIKPHSAYGMEIPKMDRASVSDLLHLVLLPDVPFVLLPV